MSQKTRSLRQRMPRTAEWIDALRAAGWSADVDAALRNAMAGGSDFFAQEAGEQFGARPPMSSCSLTLDIIVVSRTNIRRITK